MVLHPGLKTKYKISGDFFGYYVLHLYLLMRILDQKSGWADTDAVNSTPNFLPTAFGKSRKTPDVATPRSNPSIEGKRVRTSQDSRGVRTLFPNLSSPGCSSKYLFLFTGASFNSILVPINKCFQYSANSGRHATSKCNLSAARGQWNLVEVSPAFKPTNVSNPPPNDLHVVITCLAIAIFRSITSHEENEMWKTLFELLRTHVMCPQ